MVMSAMRVIPMLRMMAGWKQVPLSLCWIILEAGYCTEETTFPFIFLPLNHYLLNTYYVPKILLGTEGTVMNDTDMACLSRILHSSGGKTVNKEVNRWER